MARGAAEAARRHKQLNREASASRDAAALQSALAEAQSSHHSNAEQMLEDKEIEVASLKAQLAGKFPVPAEGGPK
mgnify:CR=1 FL=1